MSRLPDWSKWWRKCEQDRFVFYNRVRVALRCSATMVSTIRNIEEMAATIPPTHQDGSLKPYTDCLYQGFLGVWTWYHWPYTAAQISRMFNVSSCRSLKNEIIIIDMTAYLLLLNYFLQCCLNINLHIIAILIVYRSTQPPSDYVEMVEKPTSQQKRAYFTFVPRCWGCRCASKWSSHAETPPPTHSHHTLLQWLPVSHSTNPEVLEP